MKTKSRQPGITLIEMAVVITVVALLVSFALPAVRTILTSYQFQGGARSMISAALASARAIAAREQRYAGVRFQENLDGQQYIIFIIQDPGIGAYFFRAVEGLQPIRLPDNLGVMDFTIVPGSSRKIANPVNSPEQRLNDPLLAPNQDDWINDDFEFTDTTTFSIIFSPGGKLVIHGVWVRNRDGESDTMTNFGTSDDDVFNKIADVDTGIGMFYQDDYFDQLNNSYDDRGLGPEPSRRSFVIYDKIQFGQIDVDSRWSDYLVQLVQQIIYINPYTGTMIER